MREPTISAMLQHFKYKYIQEIVHTLGAGAKKVADSLNKGTLWLCKGLVDLFRAEFCAVSVPCWDNLHRSNVTGSVGD
jgi:hypothetical protein